jgi:hypothetical protein
MVLDMHAVAQHLPAPKTSAFLLVMQSFVLLLGDAVSKLASFYGNAGGAYAEAPVRTDFTLSEVSHRLLNIASRTDA